MTEKYLRRILDNVKCAVVVADQNLKAVYYNRAFKNLFPEGKLRGTLGAVTACSGLCERCGADGGSAAADLRKCSRTLFVEQGSRPADFQHVKTAKNVHEVSYSITVTPLGGGLSMGTVDDAFELEIARELQSAKNIQQRLLPAGKWAGGKKYS